MATEEEKKIAQMGNTSGKKMAERFLASVTTSNDDFKITQMKSTSKQKLDDVDGHTMEGKDCGTMTSKDSPELSNSTHGKCVS